MNGDRMTHTKLKYGCQTFTWEMLGAGWKGTADDLVTAISSAGYQGIEITDTMIGDYANRPKDFAKRLDGAGLSLVSFAYGSKSGFTESASASDDLEACRRWVDFVSHFPDAMVSMGSATVMSDGPREINLILLPTSTINLPVSAKPQESRLACTLRRITTPCYSVATTTTIYSHAWRPR